MAIPGSWVNPQSSMASSPKFCVPFYSQSQSAMHGSLQKSLDYSVIAGLGIHDALTLPLPVLATAVNLPLAFLASSHPDICLYALPNRQEKHSKYFGYPGKV